MRTSSLAPSIACTATRISKGQALGWPPSRAWFTGITDASGPTALSTRALPSGSLWSDSLAALPTIPAPRIRSRLRNAKTLDMRNQVIASDLQRSPILVQPAHHQGSFERADNERRNSIGPHTCL